MQFNMGKFDTLECVKISGCYNTGWIHHIDLLYRSGNIFGLILLDTILWCWKFVFIWCILITDCRCKSCGQLSVRCPGHCGHIDLAKPLYNPLLFKTLQGLLQITCFFCHKFKINEEKVIPYELPLFRLLFFYQVYVLFLWFSHDSLTFQTMTR